MDRNDKKFTIRRAADVGEGTKLRLHVFLARAGIASRRKCEEFILEGKVRVNGRIVTELGTKVGADDEVRFKNKKIETAKQLVYIALNKPTRYLSTTSDPEGRPIALSLIRLSLNLRLYPVGRLDYLSSGLIFFTNDGDFAKRVSHPSSGIEKEYLVETKRDIPEEFLKEYQKGIYVEGERFQLKSYTVNSPRSVSLILEEGKNREIRRVFGSRTLYPRKIHRIRIGAVYLKNLESGKFRSLSPKEIDSFLGKG
jgi:23S rRNA pseudouridine2605 synthase